MEPTCKPINKDYLTSSLKDFDSEILSKKYLQSNDEQLHTHVNEEVLNRLNVSDTGALLFDGNEINAESQTIRQLIDLSYANANGYTDNKIAELINGAPSTLDTLKEIADALEENDDVVQALNDAIGSKTDQTEFDAHMNNQTIHVTASEMQNLSTPAFTQASSRAAIESEETLSVLFGKIKKWFADLEAVAFSGNYNDLIDKPNIPTKATILNGTLTTGATTLTFTNDAITDDSMINVYTSKYGVCPSDMSYNNGILTLTFDAQEDDVIVRLEVR